jgi:hypothetical protein
MKAIHEAIALLRSCDTPNVSEAARRFSVDRSTLSKRFSGKTGSKVKANEMKQLLTKKQELVLVNHISRLYERCLPPTLAIVTTWARNLYGEEPRKNWSQAFRARHKDTLDCRYLITLDLSRHKVDPQASYEQYLLEVAVPQCATSCYTASLACTAA